MLEHILVHVWEDDRGRVVSGLQTESLHFPVSSFLTVNIKGPEPKLSRGGVTWGGRWASVEIPVVKQLLQNL